MVGRGMLVGTAQRTYIPMQVNSAGMIPLIFAQSMLIFPAVLAQYLAASNTTWLANFANWIGTYVANTSTWYYWAIYFVLVVAFTYFYAYVVYQQQIIQERLKN
jgi:preprotein translocase subunit SecY